MDSCGAGAKYARLSSRGDLRVFHHDLGAHWSSGKSL